jgi:hypothetical protein
MHFPPRQDDLMIERATTFVLGAGAHCSYGFPSGEKLKSEVAATITASLDSDVNSLSRLVSAKRAEQGEVSNQRCKAFAHALVNSGQPSIDAFLNANRHQPGFEIIGKAGIAQTLLNYEAHHKPDDADNWLKYLFELMVDGISSADELVRDNKIGFITFNYDRFLESWLHERIIHSFGLSEGAALEILNRIPIHHVYGMLGHYPNSPSSDPRVWIDASAGIKTIFDSESNPEILEGAKKLLRDTESICLLGFGFHRENIEIIDLPEHAKRCDGRVSASRYELTSQEFDRLTRTLAGAGIKAPHESQKCLQALRQSHIF